MKHRNFFAKQTKNRQTLFQFLFIVSFIATRETFSQITQQDVPILSSISDTYFENDITIFSQLNILELNSTIKNIGKIQGSLKDELIIGNLFIQNAGNGIFSQSDQADHPHIKMLSNLGVIIGDVQLKGTNMAAVVGGNGIASFNSNIGTIDNSGFIKGSALLIGKLPSAQEIPIIINAKVSGNGVALYHSLSNEHLVLEKLTNSGTISGDINLLGIDINGYGVGNGIVISGANNVVNSGSLEDLKNTGLISGNLKGGSPDSRKIEITAGGNGIGTINTLENYIGKIDNSGFIKGNSEIFANSTTDLYGIGNGIDAHAYSGSFGSHSEIEKIENRGLISGNMVLTGYKDSQLYLLDIGNGIGIYGRSGDLGLSEKYNYGTISGNITFDNTLIEGDRSGTKRYLYSGNGISVSGRISNQIINAGVLKGSQSAIAGSSITGTILNLGVMGGRAIYSDGRESFKAPIGGSAFDDKLLGKLSPSNENNLGTYVLLKTAGNSSDIADHGRVIVALDSQGDVIIDKIYTDKNINTNLNDTAGNTSGKSILNGEIKTLTGITQVNGSQSGAVTGYDSSIRLVTDTHFSDYIINGAGIKEGALSLQSNTGLTLENSIVNGYKIALSLENNSNVTGINTIFNGGGLNGEDDVISSSGDNISLSLLGESIVNGHISLKGDNSTLNIDNVALINGDITSYGAGNTINLGREESNKELRLYHGIKDFEIINSRGKITLHETAKIEGSGTINLEQGTLLVRVNGIERDEYNRVTGHALYTHTGLITQGSGGNLGDHLPGDGVHPDVEAGAKLFFKASGLGTHTIIAMNGTDISNFTDHELGTYSLIHTARKFIKGVDDRYLTNPNYAYLTDKNNTIDVIIDVKNLSDIIDPDDDIENEKELGDIWDSITKGEKEDLFAPTTDLEDGKESNESKKALVSMLDQIYSNTPYAFIGEASRESLRLYHEGVFSTKMPLLNEWITEGHMLYGNDRFSRSRENNRFGTESQKNIYHRDLNTSNILGTIEHGVAVNSSLGAVIGGGKQHMNMSGNSSLKGNSGYFGIYGKREHKTFLFTGGIGYQHNSYDAKRVLANKYQKIENRGHVNTDGIGTYIEAKYKIIDSEETAFEPKIRVSHTYISQDQVSEESTALAMNFNKKNYTHTEFEVGGDWSTKNYFAKGVLTAKVGMSYIKSLGEKEEMLIGRVKNSSIFQVRGPVLSKEKGRLSLAVDYEKETGVFYNLGTTLEIGHNKRRDVDVTAGIGYRF